MIISCKEIYTLCKYHGNDDWIQRSGTFYKQVHAEGVKCLCRLYFRSCTIVRSTIRTNSR